MLVFRIRFERTMYVLMNDMSYKQKSFFKKKCIEYGTDFHDLAKNGAFELTW